MFFLWFDFFKKSISHIYKTMVMQLLLNIEPNIMIAHKERNVILMENKVGHQPN